MFDISDLPEVRIMPYSLSLSASIVSRSRRKQAWANIMEIGLPARGNPTQEITACVRAA